MIDRLRVLAAALLLGALSSASVVRAESSLQFNRDIRPVLSDKCFACHGPDAKTLEADLRLDLPERALESETIVPGEAHASELIRRVFATEPHELMPPPETHKPLSLREKELLRRWVNEGAEYESHWSYAPVRTSKDQRQEGLTATIDRQISSRLLKEGLEPVDSADRITLIRRLSLDLTGIPPTITEVDEFTRDHSPKAYEKVVDRLLSSQRYGERMAIYWLDLVRYADTVGYHGDQEISQSPYRDYVITAFNDNMPYDRFVREQLAGDLLENPTTDQLVASGYNRLNQTTEEGGSQAKEYLAIYFADRVRNVSQVFMGATIGCAQCHDHKYDPYTTKDFYSLGAFFADLQERGVYSGRGSRPPTIRVPNEELQREIEILDRRLEEEKAKVKPLRAELLAEIESWEQEVLVRLDERKEVVQSWVDDVQDTGGSSEGTWKFVTSDKAPVHSGKRSRVQQGPGVVQHFFDNAKEAVVVEEDTQFYAWVYLDPDDPPRAVMLQLNNGSWDHRALWGSDDINFGRRKESWGGYSRSGSLPATGEWVRLEADPKRLGLDVGAKVKGMAFTQFGGRAYWDRSGWLSSTGLPDAVATALRVARDERTDDQRQLVEQHFLTTAEPMIALRAQIAAIETEKKVAEESAPLTVISKAVEPRTIRVLPRGDWMDDSGEVVRPAIPEFLGTLATSDQRASRLDLAEWLCRRDNVLTARTMVNRLWYLMFGRGICSSVDDLGGQGTYPSHPELLDALATEFVESGWDVKQIVRSIVLSEAYRRSSRPTDELMRADSYNSLLARQGRFRLPAEMIRDAALATSGLLVERLGGRSVKPYQPAGYYAQLNFPKRKYVADSGEDQYRRGVYTHWQRTFLHPMLKAFDAPSREECTAIRALSNTPVQALTLLNDPTFVEAARVLAARILHEGGTTTRDKLVWGYRNVVSHPPDQSIVAELEMLLDLQHQHFSGHPQEAANLIHQGDSKAAEDVDPVELAAWTGVARVLLNLHEALTRY